MADGIAVVAGADLDLVELALTVGGFEVAARPGTRVLQDPERTPIASLDGGRLAALQPLAPRPDLAVPDVLPVTDPAVRTAGAAVVFDVLPTRSQVAAVDRIDATGPVAWVALVGRDRGDAGALLRGVAAAAGVWSARSGRPAPVAALPWSLTAAPRVLSAAALRDPDALAEWLPAALGVPEVLLLGASGEHRALAALEQDAAGAARALFPAEVLPFHRGSHDPGAVILFTGLSGSGKSTVARAVAARLEAEGTTVGVLDGDEVRQLLSAGLGFDAAGRALNIRRIGWVAAQIARAGGTAIAAPIAPFAAGREEVRRFAEEAGARFLLVHVATPLEVCERRDRKGLYARARAGELPDFTGISSPYEAPVDADVVLDTDRIDVDGAASAVLAALEGRP